MDISALNDDQKWELVVATGTSSKELVELFNGVDRSDRAMRRAIAEHVNCPIDLLIAFSSDPGEYHAVRRESVGNKNFPISLLHLMADDNKHYFVREGAAKHPLCPKELLIKLASDACDSVRESVANNQSCPKETLSVLATDSEVIVRRGAAFNPTLSIETLHLLAEDHDWLVRLGVSGHPMYPKKWLFEKLLFDTDDDVRNSACEYLNELSQSDWLNIVTGGVSLGMPISHLPPGCLLGDHLIQHNYVAIYQSLQSAELAIKAHDISKDVIFGDDQASSQKLRM
ncbi:MULTISPECIES: HEAT repeat domain-containing protein [Aeromonas]|uniref:HEAT repeat domain-containing protein n=1 Tax=Aeromonas TaxID=642 RepID=UPI002B05BB70|nr:HEAT repeat domain-containing protein [Aeromonas jandaei]